MIARGMHRAHALSILLRLIGPQNTKDLLVCGVERGPNVRLQRMPGGIDRFLMAREYLGYCHLLRGVEAEINAKPVRSRVIDDGPGYRLRTFVPDTGHRSSHTDRHQNQ